MNKKTSELNKLIIGGSAALLLAVSSPSLLAQEVQKTTQSAGAPEEVLVTGVRRSLEAALEIKRNASSIVDAISAEDIDALPALDFGEALQVIPGVQLNRDEEGRTSEISLRGLPGNFVKTTAFGQSFATPTRSASPAGASNPFSAFEPGVFDGVTVIKSPTADLQAGGISGIVDKKLQQALSKKDGKFSIRVGGRFEDLTENFDKSISLQGSKHIIEDKLAVAFKFASSDQTFRRDTINFIDYIPLDDTLLAGDLGSDNQAQVDLAQANIDRHFPNIGAYRDRWDIPANAQVRAVGSARNVTELGDGDRLSFTGNIEYRVNDELKIGAHVLMTRRDLDSGTKEDTLFGSGFNLNRSNRSLYSAQLIPDIDSAPFLYDVGVNEVTGEEFPVYGVSRVETRNGNYRPNNRKTTFLEESEGLFLYADYEGEEWTIDSKVTYSEAENQFSNVGLDFRHNQDWRAPGSHPAATEPTNINGIIDTGQGSLSNIEASFTGWDTYVYDGLAWSVPSRAGASTNAQGALDGGDDPNGGRRVQFFVDGRVDNPTREFTSAEANFERALDFDFDVFAIESVKFGGRVSEETLENRDQKVGAPGINVANIGSNFLNTNLLSTQGDAFFGGSIPGTFGAGSGWQTFDNDAVAGALQDGLLDLTVADGDGNPPGPALTLANPTGFYDRVNNVGNNPHPQFFANNFTAEQTISAAYLMSTFSGDLGAVTYSGNVGVRYEKTENDFIGINRVDDDLGDRLVDTPSSNSYDNVLPQLNLSVNLTEDIVLRSAYYEGLIRPNIRSTNPSLSVQENDTNFNVTLPSSGLRPYTSENFDFSLEWYNRAGSAISIGYFEKEITDLFANPERNICPELDGLSGLDAIEEFTGPVVREADSGGTFTCTTVKDDFVLNDGTTDSKEVRYTIRENVDEVLTASGYELAVQQNLDFLPYPWNGLGGVFNYTKLDQKSTSPDSTSAFLRAAPRSYNVVTYWENDGISLRFAYNWRDDSVIRGANSFLGTIDRTQKARGRLDFSGSYKFNRNLKLSLRAYNLTNSIREEHFGFNDQATARYTYDGRIYQVGLNYNF